MFGWELPPHNSGGLGTACLGLSKELSPLGVDLDFVLPHSNGALPYDHMNILNAKDFASSEEITRALKLQSSLQNTIAHSPGYSSQEPSHTGRNIPEYLFSAIQQADWYAHHAPAIVKETNPDLIHCHEWMTYTSGIAARKASEELGRSIPLVAQVHATEIDRGGGSGNPEIMELEKRGLHSADRVVAVSHYTKQIIYQYYEVPKSKISVVHNGISLEKKPISSRDLQNMKKDFKLVLFMGRLTLSKGPDYFIKLAKAVTDRDPKVKFLMVGSGDMEQKCIELAAKMGLTGKILFSPFLRGDDVNRAYQLADLFIMPSVSEPFGLVALEAMQNGVPTIISKQSGVSEVSKNLIALDFWDTKAMQKAVLELLYSPTLSKKLSTDGKKDLTRLSWATSAGDMKAIYQSLLRPGHA